mgnify:FL=1
MTKQADGLEWGRDLSLGEDKEIGQGLYRHLNAKVDRLARHHGISEQAATDFLLAGALLVAASRYNLELAQVADVVADMVEVIAAEDAATAAAFH